MNNKTIWITVTLVVQVIVMLSYVTSNPKNDVMLYVGCVSVTLYWCIFFIARRRRSCIETFIITLGVPIWVLFHSAIFFVGKMLFGG